MQDVIESVIFARAFQRQDIERLFDHADDRPIARFVAANRARVFLGDIAANRADDDAVFQLHQRFSERLRLLFRRAQEVEREALRRLRSHSRQAMKFFDESPHRAWRRVHN